MICEGILQYRVRQNLSKLFHEKLAILDWDTHNTKAGRPDAVFLTEQKQLVVVEFEPALTSNNTGHALITQAWKGADKWYWEANQTNILERYEYTFECRYRNKERVPDLRAELGLEANDPVLWDRRKRVMIVAAAPDVRVGVLEAARMAAASHASNADSGMPYEARICEIIGGFTDDDISITDREWHEIAQSSERTDAPPEGPGLPPPHQHKHGALSLDFMEVKRLLPKHISAELENDAGYELLSKADFAEVLKLMAWYEYDVDVCFEFSTMDSANAIKGPHCQLRVGKLRKLGLRLQGHLEEVLPYIADKLGCPISDLECKGSGWPLKQYRVSNPNSAHKMMPDDIARALGKFCSVVYPIVNPIIRSSLG